MALNDYGKLWLLGLVMVLGTLSGTLIAVTGGEPGLVAGVGLITSTIVGPLGYLTGNGRAAARAEAPSPVFVPDPSKVAEVAVAEAHAAASAAQALDAAGTGDASHVRVLGPDDGGPA